MSADPLTLAAAEQARNVAVQMMAERGRGLVLVGAARLDLIDTPIEQALHAIRSVRNDFAHSAGEPTLAEPSPLWIALAPLLQSQSGLTAQEQSFILLVTTLVASIEACALLQTPFSPRATVRFSSR
ncbi:MAG: hypothetical protein ACKOPN_04455 [Prochlorococcaceae cyanobacterium]